jgi:SAM-dependent methyltransferase
MEKSAAWDRFWSYDRLSSFGTGTGAGNYGEHIAAGWRTFFAALPTGARVLDLCTGNGAIAVMAVEAGDQLRVTGADLAAVRPAAFVSASRASLAQVQFLAKTPAEQLPLADASFDAVVSQYGIEYSDLEQSIPEAVRVLAPGGWLRIATHAAEGSVAADTKRAIADADFLLDFIELPGRASIAFQAILDVERGRISGPLAASNAQTRYATFRDGLKAVAGRVPTATDVDMLTAVHRTLTDLFKERLAHDDAILQAKIADLRAEVEAHRERERALIAAALSGEQIEKLAALLADLGLTTIKRGEQRDGGDLIGHIIEAVLPTS